MPPRNRPNKQRLKEAIYNLSPDHTDSLMNMYGQLDETISNIPSSPGSATALEHARSQLDSISSIVIEEAERGDIDKKHETERKRVIDDFAKGLDDISEGILDIAFTPAPSVEVEKEHPGGFARRYEASESQKVFDQFSDSEKKEILEALFEKFSLSEKQEHRLNQVMIIRQFLETLKWDLEQAYEGGEGKGTWGEALRQGFDKAKYFTRTRLSTLNNLIQSLAQVTKQIMKDPTKTVDGLIKDGLIDPKIKDLMEEYDFGTAIGDPESREDVEKQYIALIQLMRDRKNYAAAQVLMEDTLLAPYFAKKREEIGKKERRKVRRNAEKKINAMVTSELIDEWEDGKKGMTLEERIAYDDRKDANIERAIDVEEMKGLNKIVAEMNNGSPFDVQGHDKQIMEIYKDMMGTGEWHNLADSTWDTIVEELVINAPLIVVSGFAASAVRGALTAGTRAAIATGRFAKYGLTMAKGAKKVTAVGWSGKSLYWGGRGAGLLAEGITFETVHTGIQGENLFDTEKHPDWWSRILWTSATLGAFHFSGAQAKKLTGFITKNSKTLFPDKTIRNTIMRAFTTGNIEAGTMMAVGAIRHYANERDFDNWHLVDQLFHSYLTVGALHVAGGAIRVGKKTFFPKDPGARKIPITVDARPKSERGPISSVRDAITAERSGPIEVSRGKDLIESMEMLNREGFKFEINEKGEAVAKKEGVEIHLRESGKLKRSMDSLRNRAEKLGRLTSENPNGLNQRGFKAVRESSASLYRQARELGFSRVSAMAIVLTTLSGCGAIEKGGAGAAGGAEFFFSTGAPLAGMIFGGMLVAGGVLKGIPRHRGVKALQRAGIIGDHISEGRTTTEADVLGRKVLDSIESLKEIKNKIHDDGHNRSHLREIIDIATDLHTELTRLEGPRRAELDALNRRFRTEEKKIYVPPSKLWSFENILKISGSFLVLGTAFAWLYAAHSDGSESGESSSNFDVEVGPDFAGSSEGGNEQDDDTASREPETQQKKKGSFGRWWDKEFKESPAPQDEESSAPQRGGSPSQWMEKSKKTTEEKETKKKPKPPEVTTEVEEIEFVE